uniref:Uncharacterized protein n=1 Tax=Anguilla anguilla TaxID=7936 RepID=A0A0E9WGB0_ANGAN
MGSGGGGEARKRTPARTCTVWRQRWKFVNKRIILFLSVVLLGVEWNVKCLVHFILILFTKMEKLPMETKKLLLSLDCLIEMVCLSKF